MKDNRFQGLDDFRLPDVFLLSKINKKYRDNHFDYYIYKDGMGVPRVSHILDTCIAKPELINWAGSVGIKEAEHIKKESLTVGTCTHAMIEYYLKTGYDMDISERLLSSKVISQSTIAYMNFKNWKKSIEDKGYHIDEIIGIEIPVITPLYGGTIDCIARINGKVYILDFKTSKQISYEYILQVCAYYWAVNARYCPETIPNINGVGIIRVDKYKQVFEDLFLNRDISEQSDIIDNAIHTFGCMLSYYYNYINLKESLNSFNKGGNNHG